MSRFDAPSPDSTAHLLLDKAVKANNKFYEGKAHFYLSHFSPGLDSVTIKTKLKHLDRAEEIALETGNDTLLSHVFNQRGVWELSHNIAPETARYWFNRSIETAIPLGKRWISIPAELNMSEACRIVGDTIGITYDRSLFEYACKGKQPELMFASGLHCAMYYAEIYADTAMLRPYIKAINSMPSISAGVMDMLYATCFYNKGEYATAASYMKKAGPQRYKDFCIFYAEILNKLGRYDESEKQLNVLEQTSGFFYRNLQERFLRLKASNAAGKGNWESAFKFHKAFEELRDSIEESNAQDLAKRYKVEYEVNVKDREISTQRQKIHDMNTRLTAIAIIVALIIAGFSLYICNRRKYYRNIVRQNLDFIERQRDLEARLGMEENDMQKNEVINDLTDRQEKSASLSDSATDKIFEKIRIFTEEKQIWRDINISREVFAEMVGCNRTYFSEAIKARTGMSYTQYMNSCRIREAIKILSDTSDDTPLKDLSSQLGFITIANFYSAFKKETGMSPAAYRKTARNLKKE